MSTSNRQIQITLDSMQRVLNAAFLISVAVALLTLGILDLNLSVAIPALLTAALILFAKRLTRRLEHAGKISDALHLHAIVSSTDADGVINYVNDKFCEISGYHREELLGATHSLVNSGRHDSTFFKQLWKTIRSGEVWHGEIRNQTKSGEYYWVQSTIVPVKGDAGKIEEFISIRTDITRQKALETELQTQHHQLSLITSSLNQGLYMQDAFGQVTYVNPAAERILGWKIEEFMGPGLHDKIHSHREDGTLVHAKDCPIFNAARQLEIYHSTTEHFVHREGHLIPVEVNAAPIVEEGEFCGLALLFEDISERTERERRLEQANARNTQLLYKLNAAAIAGRIGLFEHDPVEDLYDMNDICREFYDLPATEYPIIRMQDLINRSIIEDIPALKAKITDSLERNETLAYELCLVNRMGHKRYVQITTTPKLNDEGKIIRYGSLIDITSQHDQERRLQDALDAVKQTNRELEDQREKQRQMFSILGHELRTPLASLKMMQDEQQLWELEPYGKAMVDATHHLISVMDDLRSVINPQRALEKSQSAGSMLDLSERTLNSLRQLLDLHGIEAQLEAEEWASQPIYFGQQQIRQVIINLCKNAAIHSGANLLKLRILTPESSDHHIHFELRIEDNGRGIPAEDIERVFEPFSRGNTDADGTGLGLHICREIIRDMGGDLRYEPSALGGAAFVMAFSLPRAESAEVPIDQTSDHHKLAADTLRQELSALLRGKQVLVAEDNEVLQLLTRQMLEKLGARVSVASRGSVALDLAGEQHFDLILTDIIMPEINGYELVQRLRNLGHQTPIIGVTAAVVGEETDKLLAAGANLTCAKPLTSESLYQALSQIHFASSPSVD